MMTVSNAARWLQERDHFMILTHRRPDGDTLGSAALLCRGLRQWGKTAYLLENPETTPRFSHLAAGLTLPEIPENATVVSVDVAAANMLQINFPETGAIGLRQETLSFSDFQS